MPLRPINFAERLATFSDLWSPKIVAQMNEDHFKLVKLKGEFVWHAHADTDEAFIILEGTIRIAFRDGCVDLKPGEMIVVPKGVEHKPIADSECHVLIIERFGTVNTGDAGGELTAKGDVWT